MGDKEDAINEATDLVNTNIKLREKLQQIKEDLVKNQVRLGVLYHFIQTGELP